MKKQWKSIFKAFTIFKVFVGILFVLMLVSVTKATGKSFDQKTAKGGMPICLQKLNDSVTRLKTCNTELDLTWTDLEKCNIDLDQAWSYVESCSTNLNQAWVDLGTCNASLSSCESKQVSCPEGASVAKTGQTKIYSTGDDGDLQAGVAVTAPRFIDNGDGTVTDNLTGLIWMRNAGSIRVSSWGDAIQSCSALANGSYGLSDGSFAGDWRLPNVRELYSLIDFGHYNYALPDGHLFINVMSIYWSSTTYAGNPNYAIYLNQINGFMNYAYKIGGNVYVLCVRN